MQELPVLYRGTPQGTLRAVPDGLYMDFTAGCTVPGKGLWCLWLAGERDRRRLGVLEPDGGQYTLRRRLSNRELLPLGALLHGELFPVEEERPAGVRWTPVTPETIPVRNGWVRRQLRGAQGLLAEQQESRLLLAVPWDPAKPFLLTGLFCFAQGVRIQGKLCAVFAFDRSGRPIF